MDSPPSSEAGLIGVVLAAGWGRRMGGPKALLRTPDGRSFLQAVVDGVHAAGVAQNVVVVGPWWGDRGMPDGCDLVVNPDPDRGVISSLRLAIRLVFSFDPSHPSPPGWAILMALVDHPAVRPETVRTLVETHRADPRRIVIPVFRDGTRVRRGHPVVFPAWAVTEFFGAPADREGPRAVVRAHPQAVTEVEVADPGVVMDLDSPACYRDWLTRADAPGPGGEIGGKP